MALEGLGQKTNDGKKMIRHEAKALDGGSGSVIVTIAVTINDQNLSQGRGHKTGCSISSYSLES